MLNKNINSKTAGIILGIFLIGAIFLVGEKYLLTKNEINDLTQARVVGEISQEKVLYIINKGDGDSTSYQILLPEGSNVFSLLEELSERENFDIESTIYPEMGVLVESIDGTYNGTDDKYWQYWVNGELPMKAADKKEVKEGDEIEWRFAPSPY